MRSIALTGGIGMGKSAAANILLHRGFALCDSDTIARELVAVGQPALSEIRETFGDEMLDPEGQLDRHRLAALVFSDPDSRQRLESILHPRIRQRWRSYLQTWQGAGYPVGIVVIPLLFETSSQTFFDATVCVACSAATQGFRLRGRGWSEQQIEQRIAAQLPISQKMEKADYVIWNEGSLNILEDQLARLLPGNALGVDRMA